MADQLTFELSYQAGIHVQDFLTTPSNELAWKTINQWPEWKNKIVILHGPQFCGKTHLLTLWCEKSKAMLLSTNDLLSERVDDLINKMPKSLALDDLEEIYGDPIREEALFHLLNAVRHKERNLLIAAKDMPSDTVIKDVRSRLQAAHIVQINQPDDALLSGLYLKHFHDRQLTIDPDALNYLILRSDRSYETILSNVQKIDQESLKAKRRLTLPFIKEVLHL